MSGNIHRGLDEPSVRRVGSWRELLGGGWAEGDIAIVDIAGVKAVVARRTATGWDRDPRLGVTIPTSSIEEDSTHGYQVMEGAGGFVVNSDGTWTLTANSGVPIVRVRFPMVGLTDTVKSMGLALGALSITNGVNISSRLDTATALELRCLADTYEESSYVDTRYSASVWVPVAGSPRVYMGTKSGDTTFTLDGTAVASPLYHEHLILETAAAEQVFGRSLWRDAGRSDKSNAYGYGVNLNTGVILGTNEWLWELEIHYGGSAAEISVDVDAIVFGPGGNP